MQKGKFIKAMLAAAAVMTGGSVSVEAAEVYTLAPITVTANRYAKEDVDVAAGTQVFTAKDIEKTGADNMHTALQYLDGVIEAGMGPNGTSLTSMTSKIAIRGVDSGTLVLVNGTPVNWRTLYNLEDIPTSAVEKVEVVRGGGSVLYGSQATGGVINIITKKQLPNEIQVGLGNFARQDYKVSAHADKLSVAYNYNKWGDTGLVSSYDTSFKTDKDSKKYIKANMKQRFKGYEKNDFMATYQFTDALDFVYNHNESTSRWEYTYNDITNASYTALNGETRYQRKYKKGKDFAQLNYHDDNGLSAHVFYNYNTLESHGLDFYDSYGKKNSSPTASYSKEKNKSFGYDVQKVWQDGDVQTFLLGTALTRETFEKTSGEDYGRNIWSLFGSWDRALTKADRLTLSARGTWTTGAVEDYSNFSGQAQYLHKLGKNQSLYASVGQSFVLPTFSQMYSDGALAASSSVVGDPDLKPQKGTHYELGWKMENEKTEYKVALFSVKIKDNITFSKVSSKTGSDKYYAVNEDFKNHGIEASVRTHYDNGFAWHAGITWQDPESKQNTQKASAKTYWDRALGRVQVNGGASYEKGKWTTALNFTYLADRVMTPSSKHSYDTKPYLLTTFTAKYSPNAQNDILFTLDNVLDRHDNISHTSSYYYSTPRNFLLSWRYKF